MKHRPGRPIPKSTWELAKALIAATAEPGDLASLTMKMPGPDRRSMWRVRVEKTWPREPGDVEGEYIGEPGDGDIPRTPENKVIECHCPLCEAYRDLTDAEDLALKTGKERSK